ncbi:MAG: hypothetical protein R3C61_10730 [Bacteroidia bacterium]
MNLIGRLLKFLVKSPFDLEENQKAKRVWGKFIKQEFEREFNLKVKQIVLIDIKILNKQEMTQLKLEILSGDYNFLQPHDLRLYLKQKIDMTKVEKGFAEFCNLLIIEIIGGDKYIALIKMGSNNEGIIWSFKLENPALLSLVDYRKDDEFVEYDSSWEK